MVIDMACMVEKPFELAKLLIEENVIDQEDVLLALGTGYEKGYPSYADHRAVKVVGKQKAYLGDGQKEYRGTARVQSKL